MICPVLQLSASKWQRQDSNSGLCDSKFKSALYHTDQDEDTGSNDLNPADDMSVPFLPHR